MLADADLKRFERRRIVDDRSQHRPPQTVHDGRHMRSVADRVTLREITADTVRAVVKLAVAEHQTNLVASNGMSLAQALFAPEAWYRAIYLDDEPVGFVMLSDESLVDPLPEEPEIGVWRFMVDARYQGQGIGRAALQQIIEHVRRKGLFQKLSLSYVPEEGGPEAFYRSFGFRPTGEIDEGEVVMELLLNTPAADPTGTPAGSRPG
jgi:diamine N-acetyltransferase